MAKNPKQLTIEQMYEQSNGLTTKEQKALKAFIEKILSDKATKAADELDLINGDVKSQSN